MPADKLPLHVRVRIETRQAALERQGYRSYREYLRSPHWLDRRRAYYASELPQRCMCGEGEVDLHHMTYERIGAEQLTDLVPLCRRCHQMVHDLERRGVITLDFTGFESLARSAEYAKTRIDLEAWTPKQWHEERCERQRLVQRERSRQRRKRPAGRARLAKKLRSAGYELTKAGVIRVDVTHATEVDLATRTFEP